MTVGVVIPAYDDEEVFDAIEAVKAQDPDELVVVNAAASDEDYTARLKDVDGITYLEDDGGVAQARTRGARTAETDRVVFLDADCVPRDGWLGAMSRALEENDIVEGRVEYAGRRCPLSRLVENTWEPGRFLTANLGVRREVLEEVEFDPEYRIFREDTDFGWRAMDAGFEAAFADATVDHHAGRYSFRGFLQDRLRYVSEPYFVDKFRGDERLGGEISKLGPVLYPAELATALLLVATVAAAAIDPRALLGTVALSALLSLGYTVGKMQAEDAEFCPRDLLLGIVYIPTGYLVKRYAIWRGALRYKVAVV